jgi:hypothetical protein
MEWGIPFSSSKQEWPFNPFFCEFFLVISSLPFVLFSIAFLRAASLAFLQPNIWRVDVNSQTAPLYSSLFEPFFSFDGR